jgi:hypothetical protein
MVSRNGVGVAVDVGEGVGDGVGDGVMRGDAPTTGRAGPLVGVDEPGAEVAMSPLESPTVGIWPSGVRAAAGSGSFDVSTNGIAIALTSAATTKLITSHNRPPTLTARRRPR